MNNLSPTNGGLRLQQSNFAHVERRPSHPQNRYPARTGPQSFPHQQQPLRSAAAPFTADILGGRAKLQALPSGSLAPRTHATIGASVTPLPGGPSLGLSATARLEPRINVGVTDAGGINVSFAPNLQLEVSGSLIQTFANIFGTGLGINVGASATQRFTFGGPEVGLNVKPDGAFDVAGKFDPSIASKQIVGVTGGGGASLAGVGFSGSQSSTHETEVAIKAAGPGFKYAVSSDGIPTVSQHFGDTVAITNSYTYAPRTGADVRVEAGPSRLSVGGAVTPTVTSQHKVTFSTNPASNTPPKHEFALKSGVRVDGSVAVRQSILPPDSPVSLTAEVGFNPRITLSGPQASYTVPA